VRHCRSASSARTCKIDCRVVLHQLAEPGGAQRTILDPGCRGYFLDGAVQHDMIKPDNIAGSDDVQDRAPPIRQSAGAKRKTRADKQDRWIGTKPNEWHVACRVADRLLQKRVPQPATACQQILGNGGGITRPFGFDAGLRCRSYLSAPTPVVCG